MKKRRLPPFFSFLLVTLIVGFIAACSGDEKTTLLQQTAQSGSPTTVASLNPAAETESLIHSTTQTAAVTPAPAMVVDLADDFDGETALSPDLWQVQASDENHFVGIKDGHLCLSGAGGQNLEGNGMAAHPALYSEGVPLTSFGSVEARLMLSSDHQGGYAETMVKIMPIHNEQTPRGILCHIVTDAEKQPFLECAVQVGDRQIYQQAQKVHFDEWHAVRIEIGTNSTEVTFTMDGASYKTPPLDDAIWFSSGEGYHLQIWGGRGIGAFATGCIDDLKVMRAEQVQSALLSPTSAPTVENTHLLYASDDIRATGASGIALSPDGSRLYVSATGTQDVFVVDPSTKKVISVIDLKEGGFTGSKPFRLTLTPDGRKIYTANVQNISVIDTAKNQVIHEIDTRHWVRDVVFTPDGKTGYVDIGSNQIPVIDPSTDTIVKTIPLQNDDRTYALVVSNNGDRLIAVSEAARGIRILSIDARTASIVDQFLLDINTTNQSIVSMSKDDRYLYLPSGIAGSYYGNPDAGVNKIYVVDLGQHKVAHEISGVTGGPTSIRLSADGATGYVTTFSGTGVHRVDLQTYQVTETVQWSADLAELSRTDLRNSILSPDGTRLFIVGLDANGILYADLKTNTISDALILNRVTKSLWEIAMSPTGKDIYVTSQNIPDLTGSVIVIDTAANTVYKEIALERYPTSPTVSPDGKSLYFISNQSFMAIDLSTYRVVKSIWLYEHPSAYSGVAISPTQDRAFITNDEGRNLIVVDLANEKVLETIDVGWSPHMIELSKDGKRVYIGRRQNAHDVGGLVIVDTASNTVVTSLTPPEGTQGGSGYHDLLALSPDNTRLYWVTNADKLNVIDTATNQIVKTISVGYLDPYFQSAGYHPDDIAFTSDGSLGYIPCGDSHDTAIFDTKKDEITGYIYDTGLEPATIVISPDDHYAYMPTKNGQNVIVLDLTANRIVAQIPVP